MSSAEVAVPTPVPVATSAPAPLPLHATTPPATTPAVAPNAATTNSNSNSNSNPTPNPNANSNSNASFNPNTSTHHQQPHHLHHHQGSHPQPNQLPVQRMNKKKGKNRLNGGFHPANPNQYGGHGGHVPGPASSASASNLPLSHHPSQSVLHGSGHVGYPSHLLPSPFYPGSPSPMFHPQPPLPLPGQGRVAYPQYNPAYPQLPPHQLMYNQPPHPFPMQFYQVHQQQQQILAQQHLQNQAFNLPTNPAIPVGANGTVPTSAGTTPATSTLPPAAPAASTNPTAPAPTTDETTAVTDQLNGLAITQPQPPGGAATSTSASSNTVAGVNTTTTPSAPASSIPPVPVPLPVPNPLSLPLPLQGVTNPAALAAAAYYMQPNPYQYPGNFFPMYFPPQQPQQMQNHSQIMQQQQLQHIQQHHFQQQHAVAVAAGSSAAPSSSQSQSQSIHPPSSTPPTPSTSSTSSSLSALQTQFTSLVSSSRSPVDSPSSSSSSSSSSASDPSNYPFFSIDVECVASGPGHNDRTIAQIALVNQDEKTLVNVYVKPSVPVFSYLPRLTSLNKEIIEEKGVTLEEAIQTVISALPKKSILVGQNILKDVQWLNLEEGNHFHSMRDLAGLWRVLHPKYKNWSYFSLQHEAKCLLGIEQGEPHSAENDAPISIKLFKLYRELEKDPSNGLLAKAQELLISVEPDASFAKKNPIYDGVCMGVRKECKCGSPFFW